MVPNIWNDPIMHSFNPTTVLVVADRMKCYIGCDEQFFFTNYTSCTSVSYQINMGSGEKFQFDTAHYTWCRA